jgi:hypothetical protein
MGIRNLSTASISTGTKRSKFWDQSAVVVTNDFELIATAVPTSNGQSEVIFSSIPSTYTHLFLTWQIMGVTNGDIYLQLNATGGATNQMGWNGSIGQGAIANSYLGYINYALNVNSSYPHFGYAYINGYKNTSVRKNALSWNACVNGSSTELNQVMTDYNFTSAVNNVRMGVSSGGFGINSKLALYGIKSS